MCIRDRASQVAHIPGRIEALFVAATGEAIVKGQKLADIYSPELITAQRELIEAVKFRDVSPGLVEAAKNKLRFWKISDATIQRILDNRKVQETFPLFAEHSGIIMLKKVAVGDHLMQGQVLFEVMNLNRLWVIFDAYEEDLGNIQLGNTIQFTTPAIPEKTFKTKVTYIDPLINPSTRTAAIRTEINNTAKLLKPEMFVKGIITANKKKAKKTALTVPKTAVMWTGKRSVVYTKVQETEIPSFQFREVALGEAVGTNYLVLEGLKQGEEVVTNGAFSIDAAAQLSNKRSMMNQQVTIKQPVQIGIPDFQAITPSTFKAQLGTLVAAYLPLKDALVQTNPTTAATATVAFKGALAAIDTSLVKEEASTYLLKKLNGLQRHSEKMLELTAIEKQRKQFQQITKLLIPILQAYGVEGETIYIQHCPMAFNNRGADWLSAEEKIQNPYFGDKMMKCGSVTGTIAVADETIEIQ